MAISGKYGKINIPKIGEQEPVFILRAQDQLAMYAIEMYQLLSASHGASVSRSAEDEITSLNAVKEDFGISIIIPKTLVSNPEVMERNNLKAFVQTIPSQG
jgi:hypothetical protein